jgi:hypothetical protein
LRALLTESITQSKTLKNTTVWVNEGDFEPIEVVKEKYKENPDKWALILANAPKMTCEVTGEELIVEPKYKLKIQDEEVLTFEKKRRLEGEATVKNIKKAKKDKPIKDDSKPVVNTTPIMVPANQLDRVTKVVPKLEVVKLNLTQKLVTATASDMTKWIPQGIIDKANERRGDIADILKAMGEILQSQMAPKGKVAQMIRKASEASSATKEILASIEVLIKMHDGVEG